MKSSLFLILSLFCSINLIRAQIDLENGLVAYYAFDGNAIDSSANNADAIEVNSPILIDGCNDVANSAYEFDGIDDFIEFPATDAINFMTGAEFSISIWLKIPSEQVDTEGTVNDILTKWTNESQVSYPFGFRLFNQTSDTPGHIWFGRYDSNSFGCNGSSFLISTIPMNDDQWHNIIVNMSSDLVLRMYIDGNLDGEVQDNAYCSLQNNANMLLGLRTKSNGGLRIFKGGIDNLRIYDRSINDDEIAAIAQKDLTDTKVELEESQVSIFPNPVVHDHIVLDAPDMENIQQIGLFDSNGRLIKQLQANRKLSLGTLPSGIYTLKIEWYDKRYTSTLVIQ